MIRTLKWLFLAMIVLTPAFAAAQGLLIDVREEQIYRLPRPIIIWPQPQPPRPAPDPVYKITNCERRKWNSIPRTAIAT